MYRRKCSRHEVVYVVGTVAGSSIGIAGSRHNGKMPTIPSGRELLPPLQQHGLPQLADGLMIQDLNPGRYREPQRGP